MNIVDAGNPENPTVILLHGLGATGDSWYFQIPFLVENGYRVLAPDLPGFGKSVDPIFNWSIKKVADALHGELVSRECRSVFMVGLSMGGVVAQEFALNYQESLRGLILVNTFACLRPRGVTGWIYFCRRALKAFFLNPASQARIVAERVFPNPSQSEYRSLLIQSIVNSNSRIYRRAMASLAFYDSRKRLKQISIPTLIITGGLDTTIPLESQKEFLDLLPNVRHEIIPGGGHAVSIDQPDRFNQLILEFLKKAS